MAHKFPRYPAKTHASGRARININGTDFYLGVFGSSESYAEYARLMDAWQKGELPKAKPKPPKDKGHLTISDLIARWLVADPRGKLHPEVERTIRACVPLERLYGTTRADEFSTLRLQTLRTAMTTASWMTPEEREAASKAGRLPDWSRKYANAQVARICRMFRWAETQELVPRGTWTHLRTLPALRSNAPGVRSTKARKAVDWDRQVVPTLAFLSPPAAAIVQMLRYVGARPSEICSMKRNEVNQAGPGGTWLFVPGAHKNTHRDVELIKVIGPRAQAILAPWLLAAEPDGYVFPPSKMRYRRGCYTVEGLGRAVTRAALRAGVEHWTAYEVRHLAKREATHAFGLDHARAFLGQQSLGSTAQYSREIDLTAAAEVASKIG